MASGHGQNIKRVEGYDLYDEVLDGGPFSVIDKLFVIQCYKDFDTYMKKLDPILGYMSSRFGKENANRMMDEFFFPYAE